MPEATADTGEVRRFLTFRLASTLYALPAESVSEVIHVPAAARVPHSPVALLGLANLRGTVLPLVGLRELLGLADARSATASKAIVLDAGTPIALAVDAVESVAAIAANRVEVREAELSAGNGELLTGTFHSDADAGVAKILDIKALLAATFAQRERAPRQPRASTGTAKESQGSAADAAPAAMLVTFDVAGQEFALDLESVQEILPAPDALVAMPRAEALVLGVTSLRNRLLPLLSLRGPPRLPC